MFNQNFTKLRQNTFKLQFSPVLCHNCTKLEQYSLKLQFSYKLSYVKILLYQTDPITVKLGSVMA